jgi:hypothetical protein
MPPGEHAVRQCPQPGSTIEVTPHGAAVFTAAHDLYSRYMDAPVPPPLDGLGPEFGRALVALLDACHTLIDC